jgi:hypothetical protein
MNRWVVCLKHGTKYSAEYVNKLYNMTKRNSLVPFGFACITEDTKDLDPGIKIIPLPEHRLQGWWFKTWVFSEELPLDGTILFMDLDLVIIRNFDLLWDYEPSKFCIIKDFNRSSVENWNKFNSSVFRFQKGQCQHVWNNLKINLSQTGRYHGDQDWIYEQVTANFAYWPYETIMSYKWEVRNRNDVVRLGHERLFKDRANPEIHPQTSILVFHGDPKPNRVEDPIIVQNWR